MTKPLTHFSKTGINQLRGDDRLTRTVEIEISDDTYNSMMKVSFRCMLVQSKRDGARLELRDMNGAFLGYVKCK